MVTEITGVGYSVAGQVSAPVASGTSPAPGDVPVSASETKSTQSSPVAGAFAKLQDQQGTLGNAATTIHQTSQALHQAANLLGQAKQGLNQIVKMWPPYPAGSSQREAILNDVSGLRKMMEALAFPQPASIQQAGQALGSSTANAQGAAGVAALLKTGVSNLAALNPGSASDGAVGQALGEVSNLHWQVQAVSSGMQHDVAAFVAQAGSPVVQNQGAGVGQQLAGLSGASVGSNGALLQQVAAPK